MSYFWGFLLFRVNLSQDLNVFDFWADKFEQLPMYFMTFFGQEDIKCVIEVRKTEFVYHFWIFFLKLILKVLVMIINLIKTLATICRNHSEFVSFHHYIFKMTFIPKVCSFRVHNSVLKSFSRPSDISLIRYSSVDIDFWHCSNPQHAGLCYQNEMRKK